MDLVLLIARVAIGLGMAAHGAQKLFGWFGGPGLHNTGEFIVKLGWQERQFWATAASVSETAGGVLVALGFLWPLGPALFIMMMITAALTVHVKNGFFNDKRGWELNMLYAMSAFLLTFTGPGAYSVDHAVGLDAYYSWRNDWIAVLVAVVIGVVNVSLRRPPKPAGA